MKPQDSSVPILITGGAGFIGSAVCRYLVGAGHRVVNLDALTYAASLESLATIASHANYTFEHADICDTEAVARILSQYKPYAVIHLAAESHVDRSIDDSSAAIRTNIDGTHILLRAVSAYWRNLRVENRDAFRFIHVSTDEVFGALGGDGRFNEESAYRPNSPYAASKAASDHLVRAWAHTYDLPAIVANSSNNYGPFQFPEKLIPTAILCAVEGRPIPVYGAGNHVRDWLFVDDHVRALALLLKHGRTGETYAIGGGNEQKNIDVVRAICRLIDERLGGPPRETLIRFVEDRPGHDLRYAVDTGKISAELGWRSQETFQSGLARTVDWYLSNRTWWEAIQARGYRGERLGLRQFSA